MRAKSNKVYQFDGLTYEFIAEHKSAIEAALAVGGSKRSLDHAIAGKTTHALGFAWRRDGYCEKEIKELQTAHVNKLEDINSKDKITIEEFMYKNRMNQTEFGKLIGYSQNMVCHVLAGKIKPSKEMLSRLDALNIVPAGGVTDDKTDIKMFRKEMKKQVNQSTKEDQIICTCRDEIKCAVEYLNAHKIAHYVRRSKLNHSVVKFDKREEWLNEGK